MRIITPYGRSFTQRHGEARSIRRLRLKLRGEKGGRPEADIADFMEKNPRALIAAWISMIDKIYRKPKNGKRPSENQFNARRDLGNACWKQLLEKHAFSTLDAQELGLFHAIWESKLHPYPYKKPNGNSNFDDREGGKSPDGRAFDDTAWAIKLKASPASRKDADKVAVNINAHLHYLQQAAAGGGCKRYKMGLIKARAESISKNTLANHMSTKLLGEAKGKNKKVIPLRAQIDALVHRKGIWSRELQQELKSCGDIAGTIFEANKTLESAIKMFDKRRISVREAVQLISKQYGTQFAKSGSAKSEADKDGTECKSRREIVADGKEDLLSLYDVVRAYYKKHLGRTKKNGRDKALGYTLPRTCDELFSLLYSQELNRVANELIRLGRVMHYESSPADSDDFGGIRTGKEPASQQPSPKDGQFLPHDLEVYLESDYWQSKGQADIKRTEAFVRIWRNAISQASRSLLNWTDPDHSRRVNNNEDLLDSFNVKAVKQDGLIDLEHARAQLRILFGCDAELFTDGGDASTDQKLIDHCYLALSLARVARNKIVHFRGRRGFIKQLKELGEAPFDSQIENPSFVQIEAMHKLDSERRRDRVVKTCAGAQLHRFAQPNQIRGLVEALLDPQPCELVMPQFNKFLMGLHNLEKNRLDQDEQTRGPSYVECGDLALPEHARERELEIAWKLAKFVGLQLVYDRLFRPWLETQSAVRLNEWIVKAQELATHRARTTAKEKDEQVMADLIEAQAASILTLDDKQKLSDLFEDLAHETATAMRVQKFYDSDPDQARKQMKWIEDFKYHIIGQAFFCFLSDADAGGRFSWLLGINENSPCDEEAKMPSAESFCAKVQEIEPWQSRLYFLLHMMPIEDVSQLLHQFRKWTILEAKGEGTDEIEQAPLPTRDGGIEDVRRIISVFTLYLDMADAKYVWEQGAMSMETPDLGIEAARSFYKVPDDFDKVFPLQENEEEHRLASTRRGIRQIMRFGHMKLLHAHLSASQIPSQHVDAFLLAESSEDNEIDRWHKERDALHTRAVDASKKSELVTDFSKGDFDRYKELVVNLASYRFISENVRLNTHIRYHRLLMNLMSRLVDYAGLWERDRYFMFLALLKLYEETPISALGKAGRKFAKEGKLPEEISSGSIEFQRACELVNIGPNPKTSDRKKELFKRIREHRNTLAHFKSLVADNSGFNFTELVNETREMMSYDRKLKNAVSKSIIEILEREGFVLKWSTRQGQHMLGDARVRSRSISHLNSWRAAEKERQKKEDKIRLNAQYEGNKKDCLIAKRNASKVRNAAFATGEFSCNEDLKSQLLVEAFARLFGGAMMEEDTRGSHQ
ncbi:type VI-A CRISPR-associated RNA-guided ribonuclease Cas13a [uncultured Cohaesibacter sp.]|uniref:type VI-A CRISPR-associated RNA-guided ribonuclease Cas13a n=1 Tax=uncultured Cohaesibacter sp. TaxID=1002546 RepID=UPI002AAB8ADB|nr:type VI-A CRISPR-associated RNA-guided ribonuclease Cas13a [uncultured Cohaesibacter sp.]